MTENYKIIDILFGGMGEEHDVSIMSAATIINEALNLNNNFTIYPVFISRDGKWYRSDTPVKQYVTKEYLKEDVKTYPQVFPAAGLDNAFYCNLNKQAAQPSFFFLALHGRFSEDGAIQGFIKSAGYCFSGSDITGSACSMDKEIMKKLFAFDKIPMLPWYSFTLKEWEKDKSSLIKILTAKIEMPMFVKPSSQGSSIGITKVNSLDELEAAIINAFKFDYKVVIEKGASVREIECAVLEKDNQVIVSEPGEIKPGEDFYTYEDKYLTGQSNIEIPASIEKDTAEQIKSYALKAFRAVDASSYARIDFFLTDENEIFINEINSLPGFTKASMFPLLINNYGISTPELINIIISEKR